MKKELYKKKYDTPKLKEIGRIPTVTQAVQSNHGSDNATQGHMHS